MKEKNIWRYGLSGAGLVGLISLLLPIYIVDKEAYNISAAMHESILAVGIVLVALAGVLFNLLWENRNSYLISGITSLAAAVFIVIVRCGIKNAGVGVGFWIFLLLELVCGGLSMFLFVSGENVGVLNDRNGEKETENDLRISGYENRQGTVKIVEGIYSGESLPLEDMQMMIIGRDASQCNLIIEGDKVSRKHCGIMYCARTGGYLLCDYSFNGTYYMNGQRLTKHMNIELTAGTEVYLGDKSNILRLGGA